MNNINNNKRIAKNTLMLYFRMIITMGVSLYTVRVVLNVLGAVDYGIYNVVGGVVIMFSILSSTMAAASQRFFSFELGKKNYVQLKKTFSLTLTIYGIIAIIILFLAETIGLWFLNTKMTIPVGRMEAANWIYQFSILSFMMTMFTIPYNAAIVANERMNVYAYISIIEVSLKLLIVYLLVIFSFDKLKLYSMLIFGVTTIVTFMYRSYCKRKFEECKYLFYWNSKLFKEIINYSSWNLLGAVTAMLKDQGINILLNVFFNPAINAARGIAYNINSAITQFTTNFYLAVQPQIIKLHSQDEKANMEKLVLQSSKFAYYLMMFLTFPLLLDTGYILKLWLKVVPDYVILFSRLVIINSLIDLMNVPLGTVIQATGKLKYYQSILSFIFLLNLPFSYFLLKFGMPPEITLFVSIFLSVISFFPRLILIKKIANFQIKPLVFNLLNISLVYTSSIIIPLYIHFKYGEGFARFILTSFIFFLCAIISISSIGLKKSDKRMLIDYMLVKLKRRI